MCHIIDRERACISIHALLAESDLVGDVWACRRPDISIHALLAESDAMWFTTGCPMLNFYPRSPCGERHNINSSVNTADKISIHALLAESDDVSVVEYKKAKEFLSTLSLRRATSRELV